MSGIIGELQSLPSLYATGDKKTAIACCVSDSAEELRMLAYCAVSSESFAHVFDEGALAAIKAKAGDYMSWARFFEVLTESFNSGNIGTSCTGAQVGGPAAVTAAAATNNGRGTATADGASDQSGVTLQVVCKDSKGPGVIVFSLPRTSEDMQSAILTHMTDTQRILAHTKEYQQRLARLAATDASMMAQKESLEKEALALKENIARNRAQEEAGKKRLEELRREFNPDEADKNDDPWAVAKAAQVNANNGNSSRFPNPLIDHTCKEYDLHLLRLLKSRFLKPEDYQANSPGNCVVKPYTQAELAEQVKKFSTPQQEAVWTALDKIDEWDYNVFKVQTAMSGDDYSSLSSQPHGGCLFVTLYALLCKYNFLQKFNVDEQIALNWISVVEAGYHGNPYHNSMHAADVVQITHFILSKGGLIKRCELSDLDVFAALLAASVHDFDHPGINNNFHIKTRSYFATLYNDRSVLENLHVSSVFELMKNPAFNILASLSDEQRKEVRETMVEMVLATDMGMHGKYIARLKGKLQERATFLKREDQLLVLSMALKMADISNCGRPNDIYLCWSGKVSDEFYQQGDRERQLGLSCSPFMDRMQPALAKGQISFMNYIVIPFFEQLSELLPDLRFAVELAEMNKTYWAQHDDSPAA